MLLGADDEENLGWIPLAMAALPVVQKIGGAVASRFQKKPAAPPPPPCGFMDRISKMFGGKPRCSG